jgi:hypothetical protein
VLLVLFFVLHVMKMQRRFCRSTVIISNFIFINLFHFHKETGCLRVHSDVFLSAYVCVCVSVCLCAFVPKLFVIINF